jgi:hypothetical protein
MHRLRLFLFLLLSCAIPLQGYAHFAQPQLPCPMESVAMMADAAAYDCCDDAAPAGKGCQSGQPCQSVGQHFSMSALGVLPRMPVPATRFPRVATRAFFFEPTATWRPPAQF